MVSSGPCWQLLQGDAPQQLSMLEEESVHCVVTSPPYWGLRDYKADGQMGLEATPQEWAAKLVEVFRQVRRVLRRDGTVWLNLGDCYASKYACGRRNVIGAGNCDNRIDRLGVARGKRIPRGSGRWGGGNNPRSGDLKEKDLVGLPWMAAFALRADGWWLRSDIVWSKPNPMPESAQDRPTRAHEYIFLLSRSERYYYDAAAIRTPAKGLNTKMPDGWETGPGAHSSHYHRSGRQKGAKQRGHRRRHDGFNDRWDAMEKSEQQEGGANMRDVWTVATTPYPGPHFATFPPALIVPCIRAGCPEGGTVLDPFAGTSTTGQVALENGRKYIGIDVDPKSIKLSEKRLRSVAMQPSLL